MAAIFRNSSTKEIITRERNHDFNDSLDYYCKMFAFYSIFGSFFFLFFIRLTNTVKIILSVAFNILLIAQFTVFKLHSYRSELSTLIVLHYLLCSPQVPLWLDIA